MTPHAIQLVQRSFQLLTPVADQAAGLFYARLFEIDYSLRPLFQGNLPTHSRKLLQSLALTVNTLDRPATLWPILRQLGVRQAELGLRDHHYPTIGNALLWTLRKILGVSFTPEVEAAWAAAYFLVSDVMREAVPAPQVA